MTEMTSEDRIAMCVALGMTEDEARSQLDEITSWTQPVTIGDDDAPVDV